MTLVDIQVNGYKGVNFSDPDLTEVEFLKACEGLKDAKTDVFLPTLVTSSMEVYERNLKLISRAVRTAGIDRQVPGIHLEGPFISPSPGAVGAHNPTYVLQPSVDVLNDFIRWSDGMVRVLTLAPELPKSDSLITSCSENAIVSALGHTIATHKDIQQAADAGATLFTHLGNGIPNMLPRHPNPLWSALADDRLAVSLITDGHHLPVEFIMTAVKVKGCERTLVVSDGTHVSGMPPGTYPGFDGDIVLESDGKLHDPTRGCLAGSSAVMADCVQFLKRAVRMGDGDIDQMCSKSPLALLSLN